MTRSKRLLHVRFLPFIGGLVIAAACAGGPAAVPVVNPAVIDPSLGVNLADYIHTADGLYYQDVRVGTGALATPSTRVTVAYRLLLANGKQVDSSTSFTFRPQSDPVIKGWKLGVPGMREGGARILIIPPELGYEWRQAGQVPPDATLLFRVQLLKVQ